MQKKSNKGTTSTARETLRAKCEDGCFVETQTLTADLMTQTLSPREKNPRLRKSGMCAKYGVVLALSQLDACHHFSDDYHHDEDELDDVKEGYHSHPVFGPTRSAPSLYFENGIRSLPYRTNHQNRKHGRCELANSSEPCWRAGQKKFVVGELTETNVLVLVDEQVQRAVSDTTPMAVAYRDCVSCNLAC